MTWSSVSWRLRRTDLWCGAWHSMTAKMQIVPRSPMETYFSGSVDPLQASWSVTYLKQISCVISHVASQLGIKWVTFQAWLAESGELSGDLRPVWKSRNYLLGVAELSNGIGIKILHTALHSLGTSVNWHVGFQWLNLRIFGALPLVLHPIIVASPLWMDALD